MTFFLDWELWAKMCFVLGCLMVLVLLYATAVQMRNRHKIKRILRTGGLQKRQRNTDPEAAQIPFGVRALESGIEIEGIWHSKPNTPIPSNVGTPDASRAVSPAPRSSAASSARHPSSPRSNNLSTSDLRGLQQNNMQESGQSMTQVGNQQGYLQPRPGNTLAQGSTTVESGTEDERRSSADITGVDFFLRRDPLAPFGPSTGHSPTDPEEDYHVADENHGDLQSLYSHRRYHAAEIGQLGATRGAGRQKGSKSRAPNPQRWNSEPWPVGTQ